MIIYAAGRALVYYIAGEVRDSQMWRDAVEQTHMQRYIRGTVVSMIIFVSSYSSCDEV